MGKPTLFEIVLDSENDSYSPGQILNGTVNLDLPEELRIKCVKVVLQGYARVRYWNYMYVGFHITYPSTGWEEYFKDEVVVGKNENKDGYMHPAGRHSYTFQYKLPDNLPSSFELHKCQSAKVRYIAQCILVRSALKSNYSTEKIFSIIPTYDLNTITNVDLKTAFTQEKSKTICCICCASAPIEGTIRVARRGYVPGDTVTFDGEVENHSNRKIKRLMVELRQVCVATCTSPWRHVRNFSRMLGKVEGGSIAAKGSGRISGSLTIPPVPPSTAPNGSAVVVVLYQLRLVADPAGAALDLHVPIELTIGNVPLQGQFEEMNKLAQQTNLAGITLSEERGASAAPPSLYRTDIFSTNLSKKKGKNKVFVPTVRTYCYSNEAFDEVDPSVNTCYSR